MIFNSFQDAYLGMANNLLNTGQKVNVKDIKMLELCPAYFEIANPRDRLLNLQERQNIKKYIFGELMWYLSQRDDVNFINRYSSMWKKLSDDGIHCNSAYGKYIFGCMNARGEGVNYNDTEEYACQWDYVKQLLKKDPTTRQAVIQIKPIQMYDTKDVVCTYFLQFFIRDNKLDMIACMRSNDMMFGTTYDVFMFTFLQELMAAELGVELGTYKHFAQNLHIYEKDFSKFEEIAANQNNYQADTFKFDKIPQDFREKDLPILIQLEELISNNEKISNDLVDKLSVFGRQVYSLIYNI